MKPNATNPNATKLNATKANAAEPSTAKPDTVELSTTKPNTTETPPHGWRAWLLAARPKTLPASLAPVLVGLSLAYASSGGELKVIPAIVCLTFALLMQVASNYINDLYDYLKGSDGADRLGPKRAVAEGWITPRGMRCGIGVVLAVACLVGSTALWYGGWPLLVVGLLCMLGAYLYTGGPYPLAYSGWGDVLVLIFFGLVPVGGTYYLQTTTLTHEAILSGTLCGFVSVALLVVNNYRDRKQDKQNEKRTLVVRFGRRFGLYFYLILGLAACWFCMVFAVHGYVYAALLPQLYIVWHIRSWRTMLRAEGRELNAVLAQTGLGVLLFSLLLSAGFLLSYPYSAQTVPPSRDCRLLLVCQYWEFHTINNSEEE